MEKIGNKKWHSISKFFERILNFRLNLVFVRVYYMLFTSEYYMHHKSNDHK